MESLSKAKDPEKLTFMLSKLINCIKDLMKIASDQIRLRIDYTMGMVLKRYINLWVMVE